MIRLQIKQIRALYFKNKLQINTYLLISLSILIVTSILTVIDPKSFIRFLGNVPPVILVSFLIIGGLAILIFFLSRSWYEIYDRKKIKPKNFFYLLPIILAFMPIVVDIAFRYPETINVYFPDSMLFYPVIGFVAELVFHLIPIFLLLLILDLIFKNLNFNMVIWIVILVISLIEPLYQVFWSPSYFPVWIMIFMVFNLYLFNFSELYIFKHHGFLAMYSMRLMYYMIWHILWGHLRLVILF